MKSDIWIISSSVDTGDSEVTPEAGDQKGIQIALIHLFNDSTLKHPPSNNTSGNLEVVPGRAEKKIDRVILAVDCISFVLKRPGCDKLPRTL
jgi:hypothetical protein